MRFLAWAIGVVVAATLCVAASAATLTPVRFAATPGWYLGVGSPHACPGVPAARCSRVTTWASTIKWRDCADCLPRKTVAALPANGVAIQVSLIREHPVVAKEVVAWPPQVRATDLVSPFEGLPPRIGVYRRFARVGSYEVYVLVLFGRNRPGAAQIARANTQLRTAKLP
jgi:hypothetical protein